jgi:hypothetical protein
MHFLFIQYPFPFYFSYFYEHFLLLVFCRPSNSATATKTKQQKCGTAAADDAMGMDSPTLGEGDDESGPVVEAFYAWLAANGLDVTCPDHVKFRLATFPFTGRGTRATVPIHV